MICRLSLFWLVLCAACAGSPIAASQDTPTGLRLVPDAPPHVVVLGDSVAALGAWWPMVCPAGWQNLAVPSTRVHDDWQPTGRAYLAMRAALVPPVSAFLIHIGANDVVRDPALDQAAMTADLRSFVTALQTDYPGAVVYLAEVGQVWTFGDKQSQDAAELAAIQTAWTWPGVRPGPVMQDLTPDDGVHFLSSGNVAEIGARWLARVQ